MTTPSTKARASRSPLPSGVEVLGEITPAFSEILTPEALAFVAKLQRQFGTRRQQCLEHRQERQTRLHQGEGLDFLPETKQIREGDWKCAPIPSDIQDRRVEITGPTDRKMVINALNSGAKIFMADFEDANAPTWRNMVEGQINLRDAIRGTIHFTNPEGKKYKLNEQVAVLMPRPRGWHLPEKHVLIDGEPVAGGLFDFGLFFYHNAQELIARGSGPYFYLPKMESHLEARIWNDVFKLAQEELGIPYGTIRATVLIDRKRDDVNVASQDLLDFGPSEPITERGLRSNVSVGVQYLEAWLRGSGAVPIFNLMEDAATAEISRAQVWQWIRHPRGMLDDGRKVTKELFRSVLNEELAKIKTQIGEKRFANGKFDVARELFDWITTDDEFAEFLTLPGYEKLN
jgi:malate synthase